MMHARRTAGLLAAALVAALLLSGCDFLNQYFPTFTLTVAFDGSGTVEAGSETVDSFRVLTYFEGTSVPLEAVAAEGWEFTEWQGDCAGEPATCVLSMDAEKSVTAVFSEVVVEPAP